MFLRWGGGGLFSCRPGSSKQSLAQCKLSSKEVMEGREKVQRFLSLPSPCFTIVLSLFLCVCILFIYLYDVKLSLYI